MTDSVCTAYESGNPNATTSQPSSSLSGVVGSFFQRFVSLSSSPTGKEANQPVLYNFSDFARIDHRLKLYLCMHVLNHENELLTALLRVSLHSYTVVKVVRNFRVNALHTSVRRGVWGAEPPEKARRRRKIF